jgi:hypothetical protein
MDERLNWAIKNPVYLEAERFDLLSRDVAMVARDTAGNQVTIVASVERWAQALQPTYGPRPSPAEIARGMYVRGEVGIEAFESALDREALR